MQKWEKAQFRYIYSVLFSTTRKATEEDFRLVYMGNEHERNVVRGHSPIYFSYTQFLRKTSTKSTWKILTEYETHRVENEIEKLVVELSRAKCWAEEKKIMPKGWQSRTVQTKRLKQIKSKHFQAMHNFQSTSSINSSLSWVDTWALAAHRISQQQQQQSTTTRSANCHSICGHHRIS